MDRVVRGEEVRHDRVSDHCERDEGRRLEYSVSSGKQRTLGVVLALLIVAAFAFPATAASDACSGWFPDLTSDCAPRPEGHVSPMSMPYLFEDPYIRTEINLVGIYHNFPSDSVFEGGEAGVIALQARVAITERLAFIATKDGLTILRPDNSALENEEGFMDVSVGFKYALVDDREAGLIVTPSLRYEIPLGTDDILQGRGSGVFIPAVSVGYGPDKIHLIADLGAQLPVDGDRDSTSVFYNYHLDQAIEVDFVPGATAIVPFIELNGLVWVDSGDGSSSIDLSGAGRAPLGAVQDLLYPGVTADRRFEGADIANLGSSGMSGEDLVTMAWGFWVPFDCGISAGASYERVLSQRKDIFEQRATFMLSLGF